eukprot:gene5936-6875_t
MESPPIVTKPILTSSSLAGAENVMFSFEKPQAMNKKPAKPKREATPPPPKVLTCKVCSKKGHIQKDCPTPDINKICTNCNKLGHIAASCKVVIVNFAKYQPQTSQRPTASGREPRERRDGDRERRDGDRTRGGDRPRGGDRRGASEGTTSPKLDSTKMDLVVDSKEVSPKIESALAPTITTTTTTTTTNVMPVVKLDNPAVVTVVKDDFEPMKMSKELMSRQMFVTIDQVMDDAIVKEMAACGVQQVCVIIKNETGQLCIDGRLPTLMRAVHDCGMQFGVSYALQLDAKMSEAHPEYCQQTTSTLCVNNQECAKSIINQLVTCLESLVEMRATSGSVDSIYLTHLADQVCTCPSCSESMIAAKLNPESLADVTSFGEQVMVDFKRRVASLIRSTLTVDKDKVKKTKAIGQSVNFSSTTPLSCEARRSATASNVMRLDATSSRLDFSIAARYYRGQMPTIGVIPLGQRHMPNIPKSVATIKFQALDALTLTGRIAFQSSVPMTNTLNKVCSRMSADNETYFKDAKPVREIAVMSCFVDNSGMDAMRGVATLLDEAQYQHDIVNDDIDLETLSQYRMLIIPDAAQLTGDAWRRVQRYLEQGGSALITGEAGVDRVTKRMALQPSLLGLKYTSVACNDLEKVSLARAIDYAALTSNRVMIGGPSVAPKPVAKPTPSRLQEVAPMPGKLAEDLTEMDGLWMAGRSGRLETTSNDTVPLLEAGDSVTAVFARSQRVIYAVHPLFSQYWTQGSSSIGEVVHRMLRLLLVDQAVSFSSIRSQSNLSVSLWQQSQAASKRSEEMNRMVMMITNKQTSRVGCSQDDTHQDGPEMKDVTCSVRIPSSNGISSIVYGGDTLKYKLKSGIATFDIPTITDHAVIVINLK